MEITNLLLLLFIIFLIIISGIMSGSETALTAVSKARINQKANKGSKRAKYVKKIINNKQNVISSLLLSNNLVNILASSLATAFLYNLFGASGIIYATILMTSLIVIFAEVLPKIYSINRPNRSALAIAPIIFYLNKILYPFVYILNIITKLFLKNIVSKNEKTLEEESEEELKGMIDLYQTSNRDSEHEKEMLLSILNLNDTTVEEVFTHRKNIYSINIDSINTELIKKINASNFTRIPFWKDNPENILGVLDTRILDIDLTSKRSIKNEIMNHLKKPWFIPETTNLLEQLVLFKKKKEHLSLVVDEYGELLGLITLEDIIEEIVGEIVDELDIPQDEMIINNQGIIIANGSNNLKDLYKNFNLTLPESDASTLGGYVMNLAKKIPLYGEIVKDDFFTYKVLSHSRKQILKLEIQKN
tara:strand:+ start:5286 stop:6539 length:1254 start_codon:yes stop_codon:yes gene_type:complete